MFRGLWFFVKFGWKSEKRYIIYNVAYQFVAAFIPIISVAMPKFIIDELMGEKQPDKLIFYTAILIGYNLIAGILSHFFMMKGFTLRCKVAADFGLMMHEKLANADFENLEDPSFLDLKEKANKFLYGDMHGFSYVLDSALMIIGQAFILAGIITIIATLNPYMVLFFIVLTILNSVVDYWAKKNELELSLKQVRVERGWQYFGGLFEKFMYGKEIRINSLGDWLLGHEESYAREAVEFYKRRNGFYIKSGAFSSFVSAVQQILTYTYLIFQVIKNAISIGDFTMYAGAAAAFSGAMKQIMESIVEVKAYGIYYEAMHEYLNVPAKLRKNSGRLVPDDIGRIEFRNVSFRYNGQTSYALRNINIVVEPGEKLSIVGENGAGKTTFIKLLCRLYEPDSGEILLNGCNINIYDYDSYMNCISAVFQDYKLFSFSLKENVAFSKVVSDEEIIDVLKKAGLADKLAALPDGVHTSVYRDFDENGFEPSGGEEQKIALARALFKNAPVVILDEPTAALDPRAEYEIYQNFNELVRNKTAIYISHRLSSAKFCDKIAVFCRGEIVQYGTHEELYLQDGLYKELFDMQAQFYD